MKVYSAVMWLKETTEMHWLSKTYIAGLCGAGSYAIAEELHRMFSLSFPEWILFSVFLGLSVAILQKEDTY